MVSYIILGFVIGLVVAMIVSYLVILRKFFVFINGKAFDYMVESNKAIEEIESKGVEENDK